MGHMALNPFKVGVKKEDFEKIKDAFGKIKEDLDEHLEGINQNTNEIESNYEYLCRLEARLDAMNEKLETLMLRFHEIDQEHKAEGKIELSYEEKKIFLAIYKYSSENKFVSYSEIAKRLNLPHSLVRFYITNLIEKGIPIVKKYQNREILVNLDPAFREAQAKENLVNINESITRYI
jgi:predicted transcriptional regulator